MDLICFSHLRWSFVFQRPNHLLSRFARRQRTFFFEEPVFDDGAGDPWLEMRAGAAQLEICTPHLPEGVTEEQSIALQRQLLSEMIRKRRVRPQVLWFYTPMALKFARHVQASVTVYDCMDELSAFMGAPPELRELEAELLQRADLVFTGGQSLYEAKKTRHRNVHAFPSSVDAEHFARARYRDGEPPADQADISRPRLGFFGVIDERLDLALITKVADARPHWHLIMVGPVAKISPSALPQRPNIHWLGQKSYDELPRYIAGWDVALMPFALNASTRFISPTKTLEYLAAGKSVVSTAIADVISPYGELGLVSIADSASFVSAIEVALRPRSERARHAADAFVASTSWDRTWRKMHDLILDRLSSAVSKEENAEHV